MAGVVDISIVRAKQSEAKAEKEKPPVIPIPVGTPAEVLAFLGRALGELMDEKPNGWASAAASLAGTALKAQGVDDDEDEEDGEEGPRSFAYEDTAGVGVVVAGRVGQAN